MVSDGRSGNDVVSAAKTLLMSSLFSSLMPKMKILQE